MSKQAHLRADVGSNVAESLGIGRERDPATYEDSTPPHMRGVSRARDVADIPLGLVRPDPDQPRAHFDPEALEQLADSLKQKGQLQPIRVRRDGDAYVVVVGERRYRAAVLAGLATIRCTILEPGASAAEVLELQLVENCLRADLEPLERARAFRALMDTHGHSAREVARRLSLNPATVTRSLALLDLPESLRAQVEQGGLSPDAAYELSKLPEGTQVAAEGLSRAEVRAAVARTKKPKGRGAARPKLPTKIRLRLADGVQATFERRRGLSPQDLVLAAQEALREAIARSTGETPPEAPSSRGAASPAA